MKTFREFIAEDKMGEKLGNMSDTDFDQFLKGRTPEEAKTYKAKRSTFRNSGSAGQGFQDAARQARQGRPVDTSGRAGSPGNSRGGYARRGGGSAPSAAGGGSGGGGATPSGAPPKASSATPKPTNRLRNFGTGAAQLGAYIGADIAADAAIGQIKDPKIRQNTQTAKDAALTASSLYTNPITALAFGAAGPSSSAPTGTRDVGAYRIQRRIYTGDPDAGFDRFLATGSKDGKSTYNDPKEKIVAYRRDRVGSGKLGDKPFRVGAAKLGGQVVPVEYGSVAGQKKVGTPAQAASTRAVQQSRQVASQAKTYGATKGSALTGLGGPAKVDTKAGTLTTKGKTVKLASTQLVRDPKTGQQRVGDLAYKDGKATYIARASTASRDTGFLSNLSRSTGIGGQRERDQAAAKTEYRTALKNTQTYTKGLGITTKSATAQKLPGYGTAPAAKPKPVVKPAVAGGGMGGARGGGSSPGSVKPKPVVTPVVKPAVKPVGTTGGTPTNKRGGK